MIFRQGVHKVASNSNKWTGLGHNTTTALPSLSYSDPVKHVADSAF